MRDRSDRIDHSALEHLWAQVARDLEGQIDAGELVAGERLPAATELADIYQVARVTVQRAVLELRKSGRLVVLAGRGTYVKK